LARSSGFSQVVVPTSVTALVGTALAVIINLATEWKNNLWAWLIVALLTVGSAVVSLWLYRRQLDHSAADEASLDQSTSDTLVEAVQTTTTSAGRDVATTGNVSGPVYGDVTMTSGHSGLRLGLLAVSIIAVVAIIAIAVVPSVRTNGSAVGGPVASNAAGGASTTGDPSFSTTSAEPSLTTTSSGPSVNGPLAVTSTWPDVRGCDPFTAIAMPTGKKSVTAFPAGAADVRQQMTADGGGAWISGVAYVNLSTREKDAPIEILNIVPKIDPPSRTSPAWVYTPHSEGCGPDYNTRIFAFDLDKSKLEDKGANIIDPDDPSARLIRTEPLGPTFRVTAAQPAMIRVDATSCKANYTWSLEIHYAVAGDEHQYVRPVGPFRSFGVVARDTPVYSKNSADGATFQFIQGGKGSDLLRDGCH
jgi:hypothetical protein